MEKHNVKNLNIYYAKRNFEVSQLSFYAFGSILTKLFLRKISIRVFLDHKSVCNIPNNGYFFWTTSTATTNESNV